MKKLKDMFIKYQEIIDGIIVFILLLALLFLTSLYAVKLYNNKDNDTQAVSYSNMSMVQPLQLTNDVVNLAVPDLIGKEYLGNGNYNINNLNGNLTTYNVYNGLYNFNFATPELSSINNITNTQIYLTAGTYTISFSNLLNVAHTVRNIEDLVYSFSGDLVKTFTVSSPGIYFIAFYKGFTSTFEFPAKIQLEQGSTATPYQVPIGALKQHSQLEYDRGYNNGLDSGYHSGFVDGKNEIFNNILNVMSYDKFEVFNNGFDMIYRLDFINVFGNDLLDTDNLLDIIDSQYADKKYQIYNIYIPNNYYLSLPHDNGLITNGLKVNFIQVTNKNSALRISFFDKENKPIQTERFNDIKRAYEYIYIQYNTNTSVMENAPIYNEGYENGFKDGEKVSNQIKFNEGLKEGFDKGYDKGLIEGAANPNQGWQDLLFTIFGAFGTILAIELLPGWSIGIIVGIPIVFGIIYFIIGRKKD